eukprot:scaffold130457_cov35-Tisochrysis_lutea.AAC.1
MDGTQDREQGMLETRKEEEKRGKRTGRIRRCEQSGRHAQRNVGRTRGRGRIPTRWSGRDRAGGNRPTWESPYAGERMPKPKEKGLQEGAPL